MPPKTKSKRCPNGSRRNVSSGKCIPTKSKKNMFVNAANCKAKCDGVKCPPTKVCNPDTGKCVLRTGAVGKRLLEKAKALQKMDRELDLIEAEAPTKEIKQQLRDLRSKDPQKQAAAESILKNEIKYKNLAVIKFLQKYYLKMMGILLAFAVYQLGYTYWARQSALGATSAIAEVQLAAEAGKHMPLWRMGRQLCFNSWTSLKKIGRLVRPSLPKEYKLYEDALLALSQTGSNKDTKVLAKVWTGLRNQIVAQKTCDPDHPALILTSRFINELKDIRHHIFLNGRHTEVVVADSWIEGFSKLMTLCLH